MDQILDQMRWKTSGTEGGQHERRKLADRRPMPRYCRDQPCSGRKGILSQVELDDALRKAEATARGDDRFVEDLNPSNRDAICFPIRVLQIANTTGAERPWSFTELARLVGETKQPYNDML